MAHNQLLLSRQGRILLVLKIANGTGKVEVAIHTIMHVIPDLLLYDNSPGLLNSGNFTRKVWFMIRRHVNGLSISTQNCTAIASICDHYAPWPDASNHCSASHCIWAGSPGLER